MKTAILSLAGVFLAATAAHAMDVGAYQKAYNYQDSCGQVIGDAAAQTIATEVSAGQIDVDTFLAIYHDNCDYDAANKDAQEIIKKTLKYDAYSKSFEYLDSCNVMLNEQQAETLGHEAAAGQVNVETALSIYYNNCAFDSANKVAQAIMSGTMNYEAYASAYEYQDHCGDIISEDDAETVGSMVAANKVDLQKFLSVYTQNCSVSSALTVVQH